MLPAFAIPSAAAEPVPHVEGSWPLSQLPDFPQLLPHGSPGSGGPGGEGWPLTAALQLPGLQKTSK